MNRIDPETQERQPDTQQKFICSEQKEPMTNRIRRCITELCEEIGMA